MPHKRKSRASKTRYKIMSYKIMVDKVGPFIDLINAKGETVSTVRGPTVEELYRSAARKYPKAREK
jgi:hypothetical protein